MKKLTLLTIVLLAVIVSGQKIHHTLTQNPFVTIDVIGPVYATDADLAVTAQTLRESCGDIPMQLNRFDALNGTWSLYCIRTTIEANSGE